MSDDQDVNELKAKLQEQAAEFQSYKQECKNIEQMLEDDCQKKDEQIRQLKQDAIRKQKGQKMLKTQVSQFQAEIQNLKAQLGETTKTQSNSAAHKQEIDNLTKQNASLKQKILLLEQKSQSTHTKTTQLESQLNQSKYKIQQLSKLLQESQNRPPTIVNVSSSSKEPPVNASKYEQEIKKLKQKLVTLQKQKLKFEKLSKQRESQIDKIRHDYEEKIKKMIDSHSKQREQKPLKREYSQPKQIKQTISLTQHKLQIAKLKETIHQLQQRNQKYEHMQKDSKQKINALMNEKQNLLQKSKNLQKQLERERQRRQQIAINESPQKQSNHDEIFIEQSGGNNINLQQDHASMRMDCLLLTKRHYISPFIEIKDGKLIKVYKSTKNGFEKSLGATKHKFDSVGYDFEAIVQNGLNFAKDSIQRGTSHTILLYGSKRTSKKYLMAALVRDLKQWILNKVDENSVTAQSQDQQHTSSDIHCMYMKRSIDEQKNYLKQTVGKKHQIQQILQEIIAMGSPSSPSKSQIKNKKNQKPKVRYFSITFSQGLTLQIITTSYLNPFIKNNETFVDYVNAVVFNKLPNILQSAITNFHIITTINPIVNLYEECKNTLSITSVPFKQSGTINEMSPMDSRFAFSPQSINKQDLNDLTKKRLQNFEKQTEQSSLKARKIEDQCNYLKGRFEQLEIRLKNLINTHQQQNTYLKKSPVTLSYEKLLKFVNSVLSRNTTYSRSPIQQNFGQNSSDEYQNQLEMYIQEDAKSLDGY